MDYFSVGGVQQFNDFRFDSSLMAGGLSPARNPAGGTQNFAAMLERVAANRNTDDSSNSGVRRNTANPEIDKNDKLFQLCLELETFLVKNLLSSMRSTVQKSNLIEQGFAGKIYEDMLYDEYAKDLTRNAGFGLAEQAYLQLTSIQMR